MNDGPHLLARPPRKDHHNALRLTSERLVSRTSLAFSFPYFFLASIYFSQNYVETGGQDVKLMWLLGFSHFPLDDRLTSSTCFPHLHNLITVKEFRRLVFLPFFP